MDKARIVAHLGRQGVRMPAFDDGYAVVQHSSGPQGGYVVRPMPLMAPYRNVRPERTYRRRRDAERYADKLNAR